jgi:hypothetical protein
VDLRVTGLAGNTLLEKTLTELSGSLALPIDELPEGVCIIWMTGREFREHVKLIVLKPGN